MYLCAGLANVWAWLLNDIVRGYVCERLCMSVCVRVYEYMSVYPIEFSAFFQMNSRDEPEKTFKVAMPDNAYSTVYLRDAMSVEEFLASACARRNLNPMEHFVRVKKRRDMEDHNYFVPHRNDLIENYVST